MEVNGRKAPGERASTTAEDSREHFKLLRRRMTTAPLPRPDGADSWGGVMKQQAVVAESLARQEREAKIR